MKLLRKIKSGIKYLKFNGILNENTPVLIYQMGKVGSSSVYHSLKRIYPGVVVHAHELSSSHGKWDISKLYKYIKKKNGNVKVISAVREPVSRNVSMFFHKYKQYMHEEYSDNYDLDVLKENFLQNFDHDYPLTWMKENIERNLGINVYDHPFPEEGIQRIKNKNIDFLIFKHDISDDLKQEEIRKFLELDTFVLVNNNIGDQKYYAKAYKEFKKKVKFPEEYLNRLLQSEFFNHFYNDEKRNSIIEKWKN